MQNTLHEKRKVEAISRLKLMGVREDVRRKFEKDGTVMLCNNEEYRPVDEETAEAIRQFEREHDATVFLVVRMFTVIADLDALLFVGKYEEEWESQQNDLRDGYAMSYCINRDYPECSEMGDIAFRVTKDGAIVRLG